MYDVPDKLYLSRVRSFRFRLLLLKNITGQSFLISWSMEYIDVMENEFEKYAWRWDFIDFWASHMNTEENKSTEKEQEKERMDDSNYSSSTK